MAEEGLSDPKLAAQADLGALAADAACKVMAHIELHLSKTLLVQDLARVAHLSDRHFHRAFRLRFGVSPHVYIILRRVQVAQHLMLETDDSLSQIALACGMSDQAHFTRMFRRQVGNTPRRWRMARRSVDSQRLRPGGIPCARRANSGDLGGRSAKNRFASGTPIPD